NAAKGSGWALRLATGLLVIWGACQTALAQEMPTVDMEKVTSGRLLFRTEVAGSYREAPTVSTDVNIAISAMVARVKLTQAFTNPGKQWREGVYVFPLPENAAVDHMRMQVGERIIEGEIKEREAAKRSYEEAKAEGRKASLVEQERPNLFTNSVANIGPGETVTVTIEYQQSLRLDQGQVRLRFPMAVTPRYIPGMPLSADEAAQPSGGSGWAFDTDQVPDASRISPPVAAPGDAPVNPVKLAVRLDAGFPIGQLESNDRRVDIKRQGESQATVTLSTQPADRDFELVWAPKAGNLPRAALFTETKAGAEYVLLMLTPPTRVAEQRLPRDVVFIIDTSGSMSGASIVQAKQALALAVARLNDADRFNVIRFSDTTSALWPDLKPADPRNRSQARDWIDDLNADGGTEMAPALELALNGSAESGRVRQVLFLTDGAVGNESALFDIIQARLGASRLFTVGIGSAPNAYFMTKAAQFGRGSFTYIGDTREVQEKMTSLFRKLETPVLTSIELHWPDGVQAEVYPRRIPDLYAGEPVVVAAKLSRRHGAVELRGVQAGQGFRVSLPLAGGRSGDGIGVLWARHKIEDLMDSLHEGANEDGVRAGVTTVALEHHLVSKYTSLVAVDRTPTRPTDEALASRPVPTNLPSGMEYAAVFPQTATPAPLWLLGGLLSLLAGWLVRCLPARRRAA
ncbi:MAG TPA: marine proteobacterial sortase target protein, partial [Thiobacillaceae bacterium]